MGFQPHSLCREKHRGPEMMELPCFSDNGCSGAICRYKCFLRISFTFCSFILRTITLWVNLGKIFPLQPKAASFALNMNLSVVVIRNKIFSPADFSSKSRATSTLHGLGTNISVCNTFKERYCINFIFLAFSCILHSLRVPSGRRKDRFGFLITLGSIMCGTGLWFLVFAATAQMEITSPILNLLASLFHCPPPPPTPGTDKSL